MPRNGWLLPLFVLIVGTFMSVLDSTIVNVAVPKIQAELSASADDVEWIVTGFTLALGVAVPLSGWLGARLGDGRLYLWALLGFAAASALCGLAWDLPSLIAFRVLQAFPGGILPVVSMTLVYQLVPPARMGTAMGIYSLGVSVAPGVGPVLGGWFVQYLDWRLIFFINVPICLAGALAARALVPRRRPTAWPAFDTWGFLTIAGGLFALLLAVSEGQDWGWLGYRVLILLTFAALCLALFVVIELEVANPLLDLRVFRVWTFTGCTLLVSIVLAALTTMLYFCPQFLQIVQGMQALDAGLALAPGAFALVLVTPLTERLYNRFGPRVPLAIGFAVLGYGCALLATCTPSTPRLDLTAYIVVVNLGAGMIFMPIFSGGISAVPPELTGSASGMINVAQRAASSIAVAVFGSLSAAQAAQLMADRGALLDTGAQALPPVAAAEPGSATLAGIYRALRMSVLTQTYNNAYFATALLCGAGVLIALTLRAGRPAPGAHTHAEFG